MSEHPIEGLMNTAMNSIRDMVDVNTIIGEPIETSNGIVIIPISKVGFGFASGGSEFNTETINEYSKKDKDEQIQYKLPFGGGSGAGVSISPIAFIVIQGTNVKLLPVNHSSSIDKLFDYIPDVVDKIGNVLNKEDVCEKNKKKQHKKRNINYNDKDVRTINKGKEDITKNLEKNKQIDNYIDNDLMEYDFEYDELDDEQINYDEDNY